ncbi:MAG: glycosyltransferase [Alphaproteobacteria bacterium]|nr:glycosyltransferase [Alphaproteobacteria bacterium]
MKYFPATNNKTPQIVVALITYQHQQFISEALQSILIQDVDDLLVIIADDASTDNTPKICLEWQKKYPDKIALILHEKNQGIVKNINSIIPYIPKQTQYLCWFSGDDLLLPSKLQKQVDFMQQNPKYVMCYHDTFVRDDKTGKQYRYNNLLVGQPAHQGDIYKKLIVKRCFISACSTMIRWSDCHDMMFREHVGIRSDWLYFIEIAKRGDIGYLDEPLGIYRRHGNNVTRKHPDMTSEYLIYHYLYKNYPEMHSVIDKGLVGTYLAYTVKHLLVGELSYSLKYSLQTLLLILKSLSNFLHLFIVLPLTFFRRFALLLKTGKINR